MHVVRIVSSPENDALLEALVRIPGVRVEGREVSEEFLTLQEGAELCKVNYHTFREWVVVKKLVPCCRPSGRGKGDIRVRRSDVERLMDGRNKKKTGRKSREVKILE